MSQWSPPFIGGSTREDQDREKIEALVAMEPAVYRREHEKVLHVAGTLAGVAMEPAVYRREHKPLSMACGMHGCLSQWSPPFIGGST